MLYDLTLEELKKFLPERNEPSDFDVFWKKTISDVEKYELNPVFDPKDFGLELFDTYDVGFNGYAGQRIKGWFIIPKEIKNPLPCVVEYIGYGGGRGFPTDWLLFPSAGFATFIMDTRGQGSAWSSGDTADVAVDGSSPHFPGFMTLGVLDPQTYYYRRVYMDAYRAIEVVRSHPSVDKNKIAVTGVSQGGGISIAMSGLVDHLSAVMPDVPYLCNFPRAVRLTDEMPYHEISRFLKVHRDKVETVFKTLAYFDGMQFAVRANAPSLFSSALMDPICPLLQFFQRITTILVKNGSKFMNLTCMMVEGPIMKSRKLSTSGICGNKKNRFRFGSGLELINQLFETGDRFCASRTSSAKRYSSTQIS